MSSVSRAELESMDRDKLVDLLLDLSHEVERLRDDLDAEREARRELQEHAGKDRAEIRQDIQAELDDLRDDLKQTRSQLHHERSKLARRVTALEDDVGVSTQDALAVAEGGQDADGLSRLGLLVRHGPEAVSDQPTEKMYRARELIENWSRWGVTRDDALGTERRLAAAGHDLKTRLEDARDENLSWRQVYRAMELIDDWSGATITLQEGSDDEGKYVLVHRPEDGESP